ncbi:MAG: translation initiation factor IF-3 [Spirochaetia bacterium]|jgi:translation initiation factor IF-3|nr:translation initiation factor IF-3 [Spirochaetia bacterium]
MKKGKRPEKDRSEEFRVNEEIIAETVRLIGEGEAQVVSLKDALESAKALELDLVEVSPNQDPPIVKIVDYSKFKFEQAKKARDTKKKQKIIHVKEIKMRPSINEHDFEHKIKHSKEFLKDGDKVKFTLVFKGREMAHSDLGFGVMNRVKDNIESEVTIEKEPSQEGKNITMIVAPKSVKK